MGERILAEYVSTVFDDRTAAMATMVSGRQQQQQQQRQQPQEQANLNPNQTQPKDLSKQLCQMSMSKILANNKLSFQSRRNNGTESTSIKIMKMKQSRMLTEPYETIFQTIFTE